MKLILQGIAVFLMSLVLGGVGVYLFSLYRGSDEVEKRTVSISLFNDKNDFVDEVFDESGELMDQLAYLFDNEERRKVAVALINEAGVQAEVHSGRVFVEGGRAGLALDLLSLKGFIPGVENYSFTDITAGEGSLEYKLQQRLATQNMLSNMIATMAEGVETAEVILGFETLEGEVSQVQVVVVRKKGVNGLNVSDLEGIKDHIIAMTGVTDRSVIDIIDRSTGRSY